MQTSPVYYSDWLEPDQPNKERMDCMQRCGPLLTLLRQLVDSVVVLLGTQLAERQCRRPPSTTATGWSRTSPTRSAWTAWRSPVTTDDTGGRANDANAACRSSAKTVSKPAPNKARMALRVVRGSISCDPIQPTHHLTDPTQPNLLQVEKFGPNPTQPSVQLTN